MERAIIDAYEANEGREVEISGEITSCDWHGAIACTTARLLPDPNCDVPTLDGVIPCIIPQVVNYELAELIRRGGSGVICGFFEPFLPATRDGYTSTNINLLVSRISPIATQEDKR